MDKQLAMSKFILALAGLSLAAQSIPIHQRAHRNYLQDPACAAAWRMNGLGGDAVTPGERDVCGHGNTLVAATDAGVPITVASSTDVPAGFTGLSRSFAAEQLVGPTSGTSISISGADAKLTVMAWIKPTAPANGVNAAIISKWSGGTTNKKSYVLYITGVTGGFWVLKAFVSSNGTTSTAINSTTNFADGVWHHVALTDDDATLKLYVDGVSVATPVAFTSGIYDTPYRLRIGDNDLQGNTNHIYYAGKMDEPAIFSRALSAAELTEAKTYGLDGLNGSLDRATNDRVAYTQWTASDGSTYGTHAQIITDMNAMCAKFTTWACTTFGTSQNGLAIRGVVITPPGYTRTIMADACIHGDEKTSTRMLMDFLAYLANNPAKYPNVRWIITPIANPDGYEANTRKNANGVNLNRNFASGWGADACIGYGSPSTDPASAEYIGVSAGSEPETVVIMDMLTTYSPDYYLNYHTPYSPGTYSSSMTGGTSTSKLAGFDAMTTHAMSNAFAMTHTMSNNPACGMSKDGADSLGIPAGLWEILLISPINESVNKAIGLMLAVAEMP